MSYCNYGLIYMSYCSIIIAQHVAIGTVSGWFMSVKQHIGFLLMNVYFMFSDFKQPLFHAVPLVEAPRGTAAPVRWGDQLPERALLCVPRPQQDDVPQVCTKGVPQTLPSGYHERASTGERPACRRLHHPQEGEISDLSLLGCSGPVF